VNVNVRASHYFSNTKDNGLEGEKPVPAALAREIYPPAISKALPLAGLVLFLGRSPSTLQLRRGPIP